jgi:hypothetical protein
MTALAWLGVLKSQSQAAKPRLFGGLELARRSYLFGGKIINMAIHYYVMRYRSLIETLTNDLSTVGPSSAASTSYFDYYRCSFNLIRWQTRAGPCMVACHVTRI